MKKNVILVIAIVLPVLGVIIFNFFSRSHFTIPVYYQESVIQSEGCEQLSVPYSISEKLAFQNEETLTIYPMKDRGLKIFGISPRSDFYISEFNKISDTFFDRADVTLYLFDTVFTSFKVPISGSIKQVKPEILSLEEVVECQFLFDAKTNNNALLVDGQNRIRGYYDLLKREETDSLIIETKILLRESELN